MNSTDVKQTNQGSLSTLSASDIQRLWVQMLSIYGHKWASINGTTALKDDLTLSIQGIIWQKGLTGITREMASKGFSRLGKNNSEWPPALFEFADLCWHKENLPSLDEVIKILTCGTGNNSTVASRNKHPLVLAMRSKTDMHYIRTMTMANIIKTLKPIYTDLVKNGFPDWPAHAFDVQVALAVAPKQRDRSLGLRNLSSLRQAL